MVDENDQSLLLEMLLHCMIYADHLLAFHDSDLVDKLKSDLIKRVKCTKDEQVRQTIWRIIVVGWYKFARDAKSAIELITLFLEQSRPDKKPEIKDVTDEKQSKSSKAKHNFYELLFSTKEQVKPIELFYWRFYFYP